MRRFLLALVLMIPLGVSAESRLPFMKDKVGDVDQVSRIVINVPANRRHTTCAVAD